MSFGYPGPVDQGKRLRTLLTAYRQGGGRDAVLLIHSEGAGSSLIDALGRAARTGRASHPDVQSLAGPARPGGAGAAPPAASSPGAAGALLAGVAGVANLLGLGGRAKAEHAAGLHGIPAQVLPVAVWHTASIGMDLWLAAIAQGASQVRVLLTHEEAPDYRRALAEQMAVAQAILTGLGYGDGHFRLIETSPDDGVAGLDAALRGPATRGVSQPATFAAQADKRTTLDMAIEHLAAHAPVTTPPTPPVDEIALPQPGSPYGTVLVDAAKCTLCLSCVGACPAGALADNADKPQLRFIEKNCVQCGLCVSTCPEDAITLQPRLWLADAGKARKAARVVNEAAPFHCIRCAKPFGTLMAIEKMISTLGSHAAFQGAAADRLKMCSDCRVVDMYSASNEVRITDLPH
jgi:ferredoxin